MIKTFNLQQGEFLLKNPLLLHFYYLKQANPNAVLYTDGKGNVGYFNKENHVSVYCNDEEFIAQFYDVLPKGELHFSATSPFVRNWIAKRHQFVWTCDCNFYYYNGKPLPQPQHEVGSLTVVIYCSMTDSIVRPRLLTSLFILRAKRTSASVSTNNLKSHKSTSC